LSNEEKTNDYENFEKGRIYMKILKKRGGGSREKGGGGNEIHAPCACGTDVYTICGYSLKFDGTGLKIIFYHLHKCCIIYNMTIL
jgi:hypothetical protein